MGRKDERGCKWRKGSKGRKMLHYKCRECYRHRDGSAKRPNRGATAPGRKRASNKKKRKKVKREQFKRGK